MRLPIKKNILILKYGLVVLLGQFFHDRNSLMRNVRKAFAHYKKNSHQESVDYFFVKYLPLHYKNTKKVTLVSEKISLYEKLFPYVASYAYQKNYASQLAVNLNVKPKILIIRTGAMGDVILSTPIVRKIFESRKGFCEITFCTDYPDVFLNSPYIHSIIRPSELAKERSIFQQVIDLDMSLEKNKEAHPSLVYAFYALGLTDDEICLKFPEHFQPQLFATRSEEQAIQEVIARYSNGFIVSHHRFNPNQPYRNVPSDLVEKLLISTSQKFDLPILQIGTKAQDHAFDSHPLLVDMRDCLSLGETKLLIENSRLFIGPDAGPLHIAACTSKPIISFFSIVHHEYRRPLRAQKNLFYPIIPKIDCYGCTKSYPLPWSFKCVRYDSACSSLYDMESAYNAVENILNQDR